MSPEIDPPTERTCERCGRQDTWDETAGQWRIAEQDGDLQVGDPYCIHEWDVTAEYNPIGDA